MGLGSSFGMVPHGQHDRMVGDTAETGASECFFVGTSAGDEWRHLADVKAEQVGIIHVGVGVSADMFPGDSIVVVVGGAALVGEVGVSVGDAAATFVSSGSSAADGAELVSGATLEGMGTATGVDVGAGSVKGRSAVCADVDGDVVIGSGVSDVERDGVAVIGSAAGGSDVIITVEADGATGIGVGSLRGVEADAMSARMSIAVASIRTLLASGPSSAAGRFMSL